MKNRISISRTTHYDEETGQLCSCMGKFWKTCPLRVANSLPCQESIVTITKVERSESDPAAETVKSLDKKFDDLKDALRSIDKLLKP